MKGEQEENWVSVASVGDVEEEDVIQVKAGDMTLALYLVEGKYYATDDNCTHEDACLSGGYVDGNTIECPLHQGVFCISTGEAIHFPVEEPVQTYPTRTEGNTIFVKIKAAF